MKDILIRPYDSTDKEFIYATWLNNYKQCSHVTRRIRNQVFYVRHQEIIERLLARATTQIACLPDTPDAILGYMVSEHANEPTIHFCLVKSEAKGLGIARDLLSFTGFDFTKPIYFTHWTDPMDSIVNRKDIELIYDPYKI